MGSFSIWHWLIVAGIALLLFGGGGKIPKLMRDLGQGVNAFKRGLKDSKNITASETTEKIETDENPNVTEKSVSSSHNHRN